jgi:DegV family protein with EDD domain
VTDGAQTVVVCDTTAYLPAALAADHAIQLISLYVTVEGEQRRESEITDYAEFFEQLRAADQKPTTSQPSVGDFTEIYEPQLAAGKDIVSVHLSSTISGTCEAAGQARQRLIDEGKGGERIHVFDSKSSCGGQAMAALAAANAAAAGGGGAEVAARAQNCRDGLKMWFAVDTLEYLRIGGRIGLARAWIGSTLKIKPILTFEEEITPVERVRTRSRAIQRLRDYASRRHESGADAWVVQHICDPEAAETLAAECRQIFGCDEVFISEIGPVIGAHAGPGLLGVGSVPVSALG